MSTLVAINFRPDPRTLRQFGFAALAGFGALSLLAFYESGIFRFGLGTARLPTAAFLGVLALSSGLFSLVFPRANRPAFVALSLAAYPVGLVMSYVVMGILFFGVFGAVSLVMRLVGRDPLARARDGMAKGYWTVRTAQNSREDYFRQF